MNRFNGLVAAKYNSYQDSLDVYKATNLTGLPPKADAQETVETVPQLVRSL